MLTFEYFRAVDTFVEAAVEEGGAIDRDAIEQGFLDAESEADARDEVVQELRDAGVDEEAAEAAVTEVRYLERDSNNYTHANAVFHVSITAEGATLDAAREAFSYLLGD